jgi:4,4'-diaponeurosporenoate glycosyltransferase
MSVDLVVAVVGLIAGIIGMFPARSVVPETSIDLRELSVIIPARNEERNIERAVLAVRHALGLEVEIIVADDHSTDLTASEASRHGATVVRVDDLPSGWAGKPHACWVGHSHASRPYLMFMDADVRLGPRARELVLAGLGAVAHSPTTLFSVQPWHVPGRFAERFSMLFNIVSVMASRCRGMLQSRHPLVFGPIIVCSASEYRARGGHGHDSVRSSVVEDVALGRLFDRCHVVVGSPQSVTFRMYDTGFRGVMEGFSKNMASASSRVSLLAWCVVVLWFVFLTSPIVVGTFMYPLCVAQVFVASRVVGKFRVLDAALYPVHVIVFVGVVAVSVWRSRVARSVSWKGRRIAV